MIPYMHSALFVRDAAIFLHVRLSGERLGGTNPMEIVALLKQLNNGRHSEAK